MNRLFLLLTFLLAGVPLIAQQTTVNIDSLINHMSLKEKIGQMTQLNLTTILKDRMLEHYEEVENFEIDTAKLNYYLREWHVGSFLNGRAVSQENWYNTMHAIHSTNAKHSSIPLLYGIDHMHGASYLKNSTIFPHNMNVGCTFDTTFAYDAAWIAAYESADLGHNWIFAPVLGIGRSKIWGRFYETYSEDPYLTAKMGAASVRGTQDSTATAPYKTAACAKHFIGYSEPKSGWDRTPALIPDQELREFFLPPFRAAIDAGAKTLMINSGEINGIPVHASYDILTTMLRDELGFEGIAVTDWLDIKALEKMHYVAENEKEATFMAIKAGVDMSMVPTDTLFSHYLYELVNEGRISEERINTSVRRILKVKAEIGLFDNVLPRNDRFSRIQSDEHKAKSLQAAQESLVLMKNEEDLLPLKGKKIVLAGSTADNKAALCGGWTYRFAADGDRWFPENMPTIKDAMETTFGAKNIIHANEQNIDKKANKADVIVIATGEDEAYAETQGTIEDLHLDPEQIQLIKKAIATEKPVVLLLTEGRPRLIQKVYDDVDAALFCGLPGIYGAQAIADVLSGEVNPSGKMSFSYPKSSGHMIPYNHKRSEYSSLRPVSDELKRFSIAPFGHGVSYADFSYDKLKMDTVFTSPSDTITVSVEVTNTADVAGKEAVLWFVSDEVATITRPVKELVSFDKKMIRSGETVTFSCALIPKQDLSFPDKEGNSILEAGAFTIQVGDESQTFYYKPE